MGISEQSFNPRPVTCLLKDLFPWRNRGSVTGVVEHPRKPRSSHFFVHTINRNYSARFIAPNRFTSDMHTFEIPQRAARAESIPLGLRRRLY